MRAGFLALLGAMLLAHAAGQQCPVGAPPQIAQGPCYCGPGCRCQDSSATSSCLSADTFAASCTTCSCAVDEEIFSVTLSTTGGVLLAEQDVEIRWTSTSAVAAVNVKLYDASQSPPMVVESIAISAENTGRLLWQAPETTGTFFITACLPSDNVGGCKVDSNVPTEDFTVVATCPAGSIPEDNGRLGCRTCAKGSYALGLAPTQCQDCPTGWTTPKTGATSLTECDQTTDMAISNFVLHENERLAITHDAGLLVKDTTINYCAQLCLLNQLCASFEFTTSRGDCQLVLASRDAALPGTIKQAAGVQLYEKAEPVVLDGSFTVKSNMYVRDVSMLLPQPRLSARDCAAVCLHMDCFGFVAGTSGRTGECYLITNSKANETLVESVDAQLDTYLRKSLPDCAPGSTSPSGDQPDCEPCPVGTYAALSARSCAACGPQKTTNGPGAASITQCVDLTCPANSVRSSDSCLCSSGFVCNGPSCKVSDGSFPIGCTQCQCVKAQEPPLILDVPVPKEGDVWYLGDTYDIKYEVTSSIKFVTIALYRLDEVNSQFMNLVTPVVLRVEATGTFKWTVPTTISPSKTDVYTIAVFHNPQRGEQPAPYHRRTGFFSIHAKGQPCPPGFFNPTTGTAPCEKCPIGTYFETPTTCAVCPDNSTTHEVGSTSVADCTIAADSPLQFFNKVGQHYLAGRNNAGSFIETYEHKTLEECAQMCVDDAGCKSFDAGRNQTDEPELFRFQAGDCFLSYDNRTTGELRQIEQLDYWEKKEPMQAIAAVAFERDVGCQLPRGDMSVVHLQDTSKEACAQLCVHDVCCKSFEAGTSNRTEDSCFLSYEDPNDLALECSDDVSHTLFRKTLTTPFAVGIDRFPERMSELDLANSASQRDKLASRLRDLVATEFADGDPSGVTFTLFPSTDVASTGLAGLGTFTDSVIQSQFEAAVAGGILVFRYSLFEGPSFVATFEGQAAPCPKGYVSQTGDSMVTCQQCRTGTFSNSAQTRCETCPPRFTSPEGSSSIQDCVEERPLPTSDRAFALNDGFIGHFDTTARVNGQITQVSGQISIAVTRVDTPTVVQLLVGFRHDLPCDVFRNCRVPGHAEMYYIAAVDGDKVTTRFSEFAGITDRSFPILTLSGELVASSDGSLSFNGNLGSGTFTSASVCSLQQGLEQRDSLKAEDTWVGSALCGDAPYEHRRLEVVVSQVNTAEGMLSATATFTYDDGSTGVLSLMSDELPNDICRALELTPNSDPWVERPDTDDAISYQLAGSLSLDGLTFSGQLNRNPSCRCSGEYVSLPSQPFFGRDCAAHGNAEQPWCFVSKDCPDAVESSYRGLFRANCGELHCRSFTLNKICTAAPLCDVAKGWKQFNNRCFKLFADAKDFSQAQETCLAEDAMLTSIHSNAENEFVCQLTAQSQADVSSGLWLGARQTAFSSILRWLDGTSYEYEQYSSTASSNGCAALTPTADLDQCVESEWMSTDCSQALPFVCKKLTLGADNACECVGVSDSSGKGAACEDKAGSFCYTSKFCTSAKETAEGLWQRPCDTTPPSCHTVDPRNYTAEDGTCKRCATAGSCRDNQVFVEFPCTEYSSPGCFDCDATCATCFGVTSFECSSCPSDRRLLDAGLGKKSCVLQNQCPEGTFDDGTKCAPCSSSCRTCKDRADKCLSCHSEKNLFLNGNACVSDCQAFNAYVIRSAGTCEPCKTCSEPGIVEYRLQACSADSNTVCARVTQCQGDEYESLAATVTSDRTCVAKTKCAPGFRVVSDGNATANRVCAACPMGTSDVGRNNTCAPCPNGTTTNFVGAQGPCPTTGGSGGLTCAAGEELVDSFGVQRCVACLVGRTFKPTTGNYACRTVTECGPGFEEASRPTLVSDRVCQPCIVPETYKSGFDGKCVATRMCGPGAEEELPPTPSTDRGCTPCKEQYFKSVPGQFPCTKHSPACRPGTFESVAATGTSDRLCLQCPQNTFQDVAGATGCKPITDCSAGSFVVSEPTTERNRQCRACRPGTASTGINQATCTNCAAGTFQPAAGQTLCRKWSDECPKGSIEEIAPTASSDRVCAIVDPQTAVGLVLPLDYDVLKQGNRFPSLERSITAAVLASSGKDGITVAQRYPSLTIKYRFFSGSTIAMLVLSDKQASSSVIEAAQESNIAVSWDQTVIKPTVTSLCEAGEVRGPTETECRQCRPGTYADPTRQTCMSCSQGLTSFIGADSVSECFSTNTNRSTSSSSSHTTLVVGIVVAAVIVAIGIIAGVVLYTKRRTPNFGTNVYTLPPVTDDGTIEFENPLYSRDAPILPEGRKSSGYIHESVNLPVRGFSDSDA